MCKYVDQLVSHCFGFGEQGTTLCTRRACIHIYLWLCDYSSSWKGVRGFTWGLNAFFGHGTRLQYIFAFVRFPFLVKGYGFYWLAGVLFRDGTEPT